MYLGKNLNMARHFRGELNATDGEGSMLLLLDGRENGNPAAQRAADVPDGQYRVTRTDGSPPGDVGYWGEPVA